jgi:hypothetical protein
VATNLLLAENANIAGWIFRNNRMESQDDGVFLDGINGKIIAGNATDKIIIESTEDGGKISFMNGDVLAGEWRFTDYYTSFRALKDLGNKKTVEAKIMPETISITTSNFGSTASSFLELCAFWASSNYLVVGNATYAGMRVQVSSDSSMSLLLKGLPTSKPSQSGYVWRDGETLKIVP